MRFVSLSMLVLLTSIPAFGDDQSVNYDGHTDFATLKTFAVRGGQVSSQRPELNNPIAVRKVGDAIREELRRKGLKETADRPDVVVDYSITSIDYTGGLGPVGLRGDLRGGPLHVGSLPGDVSNSEATLVIDVHRSNPAALVWRGVYRDSEGNGAKLPQKLPGDVKKLFSEYPPKKKSTSATIPGLPIVVMLPCPGTGQSIAPVSPVDHMDAARLALCRASDALHKAVPQDKGGYLETSIASVNQVLTHVHYSVAYRSSHPDSANEPPPAPAATLNFNLPANGARITQMAEALAELKTAFEEFSRAPGGNLGGLRDTVNQDFAAAIKNINSGITYAQGRGR